MFRETGLHDKPYLVNLNTTAIVKNYEILREFLLSWRIWYRPGLLLPWETVLLALEALTSNIHPFSEFNVKQFERADALGILLLGCQVGVYHLTFFNSFLAMPLHFTPLHFTLLHSTLLHSTPLYSTPFHSIPLYSTPFYSTPLHSTPLHSTSLHCIPPHLKPFKSISYSLLFYVFVYYVSYYFLLFIFLGNSN